MYIHLLYSYILHKYYTYCILYLDVLQITMRSNVKEARSACVPFGIEYANSNDVLIREFDLAN